MQEIFSIVIGGPDCTKRKEQIRKLADEKRMSVSKFLLWLFDQYVAKHSKKTVKA